MHDIVSGGLIRPPRARGQATAWREGLEERVEDRLTRLRRGIMRLDDQIRVELSKRHPKIERVFELRDRERQLAEEVQALARALHGRGASLPL